MLFLESGRPVMQFFAYVLDVTAAAFFLSMVRRAIFQENSHVAGSFLPCVACLSQLAI
jgi:hypothetical protein